jgi:hypothetical protein
MVITRTSGTTQRVAALSRDWVSRHKFMERIDAPTNARRDRVTDRSFIVIGSGPYGHPTGATGVHARRTAILPEAVGRRRRGSAMFAAKPHEAEQGLPEGIREPRNVVEEWRRPVHRNSAEPGLVGNLHGVSTGRFAPAGVYCACGGECHGQGGRVATFESRSARFPFAFISVG